MRRYSPSEMSEILKLAEELKEPRNQADGYSLAEIQAVASEMGMDPTRVALAAARFDSGPTPEEKSDPWRHHYVRRLPFQVTDSGWERMVDQLRSHMGITGTVRDRTDGSREWTSSSSGETVLVVMTSDGSSTQIDITVNRIETSWIIRIVWGIAFFISALMGFGIASKGGMTAQEFLAVLAFLGAELAAAYASSKLSSSNAEKRYASLADKMETSAAIDQRPALTQAQPLAEPVVEELRGYG